MAFVHKACTRILTDDARGNPREKTFLPSLNQWSSVTHRSPLPFAALATILALLVGAVSCGRGLWREPNETRHTYARVAVRGFPGLLSSSAPSGFCRSGVTIMLCLRVRSCKGSGYSSVYLSSCLFLLQHPLKAILYQPVCLMWTLLNMLLNILVSGAPRSIVSLQRLQVISKYCVLF